MVVDDAVLVEELGEPVDQLEVGHVAERDPRDLVGVAPGAPGAPFEEGHLEVEDHVVVLVLDALDPADERAADALEAGLLGELPHHGLREHLAGLHTATGNRPLPLPRLVSAADEQQLLVPHDDGPDAHARRRAHGASVPSRLCTTIARAVSP